MKKYAFIAIAALTATFAACGNSVETNNDMAEPKEKTPEKPAYIIYTNEKYGFSVEIPGELEQRAESMSEEGAVFSADGGSTITFNRIDIAGGKQIFDEEYTSEKVQEEFEYWTEGKTVASKECGENSFMYTIKGEMLTELDYRVYNGTKVVVITICYDADHEKQLGGEVAEHVFKSVKFN